MYEFRTKPFAHQVEAFKLSKDRAFFALLMEQGTGKTKVVIDTAGYLFEKKKIDAVFVVAPNGVHKDWVSTAFPEHFPLDLGLKTACWISPSSATKKEKESIQDIQAPFAGLKVFSMNVEALGQGKAGFDAMEQYLTNHTCLFVVDESTRIKNVSANRTKRIVKARNLAPYRRILTGTPVTNNPLDVFSQFYFLDPEIIGIKNYFAFRQEYAIMKTGYRAGKSFPYVVAFRNETRLAERISTHSFRVLAKDCLDLPPVIKSKSLIILSKEQTKLYKALQNDLLVEYQGSIISTQLMLTKLLRLRQITGGFLLPPDGGEAIPVGKSNPKMHRLLEIIEDLDKDANVIIWASFTAEIKAIQTELCSKYSHEVVCSYYGETPEKEREQIRKEFGGEESTKRFFVGNPSAGGTGLNLTAANYMIYYSTSYSLEERLQSQKRMDRIGQLRKMTQIDLVADGTIDATIHKVLDSKKELADVITQDNIRNILVGEV